MTRDFIERRVLAALRPTDAVTGATIRRGLEITGNGVRITRNHRGLYVLRSAPGLDAYTHAFAAPPALPGIGSTTTVLFVRDPLRLYLPRRVTLRVPRNPDPQRAAQQDSLFQPVVVALYPGPAAPVAPNWAVLRISVRTTDGRGISNALIRVERVSDNDVLTLGLTDERGEALVPVAGIPAVMTNGNGGAVLATEVEVQVRVFVDPSAAIPLDPHDLDQRRAGLPTTARLVRLASGRTNVVVLSVALP